tara:strand:- start:91 stop:534 length:444 start_codon:yes stop_codon:yes gene_type:complete
MVVSLYTNLVFARGRGMSNANKKVVREAYTAISGGDAEGFFDRLSDDVEWYFIGSHRFSGTMKGKEQIVNDLFNVLGDQLEGTGISLEIKQLIAEGDKVVAEMQGTSRSVSGKDYNNTYNIILTVKDGLITEMREYLDTELITEVFG